MLGLRPTYPLEPVSRGSILRPHGPERISSVPVPTRHYSGGEWEERWSETIALFIDVATGAVESFQSRWIQQPFLLRGINYTGDAIGGDSQAIAILTTSDAEAGTMLGLRQRRGLIQGENEGSTLAEVNLYSNIPRLAPGTIFTAVPTRLTLVVYNAGAAAQETTVFLDLTYLAPASEARHPHYR